MQTRVNTPKAKGSGPAQSKPSSARPPQKVRKKEKINYSQTLLQDILRFGIPVEARNNMGINQGLITMLNDRN